MRTVERAGKGGKVTAQFEWQTCDTDAEWHTSHPIPLTAAVLQPEGTLRSGWVARRWPFGVVLVIILATIGGWTWSVAQRGVVQIEAELRDSVELDLWTKATQDGQVIHKRIASAQGDKTHPFTSTIQLLALPGETALVHIVTQLGPDQPTLRQTRFYQQTVEGWLPIKPDAKLWGSPRRLESSHFIFNFRQNDADVVAAVAPQIDDVYAELERNFGLTPNAEKLVIEVTVEQVTGATFTPQWEREPLVVPSPAIYLAPVELSDSAILAQSIALPLIEFMSARAIEDNAIPPRWRPFLLGLRLWQLWDLDMPLARWRHEVVTFLYTDAPTFPSGPQYELTKPLTDLCAIHSLWMYSPTIVGIPFECRVSNEGTWVTIQWLALGPYSYLDQLNTPLKMYESSYDGGYHFFGPTERVAIATLLEYIVAAYGYEQLPVLLAGLAQYDDWETLIPAVFGVSLSKFEAGWRSYLAQQYNVSLGH
jgi:hypothetical protein